MSKKQPVAQVRLTPELVQRVSRLRDAIAPADLTHPAIYRAGLDVLEAWFSNPAAEQSIGKRRAAASFSPKIDDGFDKGN